MASSAVVARVPKNVNVSAPVRGRGALATFLMLVALDVLVAAVAVTAGAATDVPFWPHTMIIALCSLLLVGLAAFCTAEADSFLGTMILYLFACSPVWAYQWFAPVPWLTFVSLLVFSVVALLCLDHDGCNSFDSVVMTLWGVNSVLLSLAGC